MLGNNLKRRTGIQGKMIGFFIVAQLVIWLFLSSKNSVVRAQSITPTVTPGEPVAVLTIVLRDSIGNPLEGVTCEVLSYGWGLQINEAFAVIARGETDKNGVVAFDDSRWPNAGYRFRFAPTDHVKPAGTYFLPDDQNQYRGYPGAVVGGKTETQRFVLSGSDSVVYNDISKEGQSPAYKRDPIAGLEKPRTTLMDGKDYIASVVAATSTAEARGEPTPTFPAPPSPSPRPGEIQLALTITPDAVITAAAVTAGTNSGASRKSTPSISLAPATSTPIKQSSNTTNEGITTASLKTERATRVAMAQDSSTVTPVVSIITQSTNDGSTTLIDSSSGSNLLVSILLAIFGVVCLILFWKFRFKIYPLFGIEASQPVRRNGKAAKNSDSLGKTPWSFKHKRNSTQNTGEVIQSGLENEKVEKIIDDNSRSEGEI